LLNLKIFGYGDDNDIISSGIRDVADVDAGHTARLAGTDRRTNTISEQATPI